MNGWLRVVGGALLLLIGTTWTLQGSDALGATGGMNGRQEWLLIGIAVAGVGLLVLISGIRRIRSRPEK